MPIKHVSVIQVCSGQERDHRYTAIRMPEASASSVWIRALDHSPDGLQSAFMKPQIVLGPYLLPGKTTETAKCGLVPLGITLEWATTSNAVCIPLYRYCPPHCTQRTRLEHIVLPVDRLAIPIECPHDHTVTSKQGAFVPLEAVLLGLYRNYQIERSVFAVLGELAALVRLHGTVSKPIPGSGFLNPKAEERGFRLNTVIRASSRLVGEIVWEPPTQNYRFHVCLCSFGTGGQPGKGKWVKSSVVGVSLLLHDELRRICSDPPISPLASAGVLLLSTRKLVTKTR